MCGWCGANARRTLRLKRAFSRPDMVAVSPVSAVVVWSNTGKTVWACVVQVIGRRSGLRLRPVFVGFAGNVTAPPRPRKQTCSAFWHGHSLEQLFGTMKHLRV